MIDVRRLNAVLPASGIQTQDIATVTELCPGERLDLVEPPAGQDEPMVDALKAVEFSLVAAGAPREDARLRARGVAAQITETLPIERRPWMLDFASEWALYVPVSVLTRHLRALGGPALGVAEFLDECAEIAAANPVFVYGEFGREPRSLKELALHEINSGMTEFFLGIQWDLAWYLCEDGNTPATERMNAWYDGMRSRIEALSERLDAKLFHYRDPDCDTDDDLAHRYLALDYVCHMIPDSPFIEYLIAATGAGSIDELRSALLDPAAYDPAFVLFDAFNGIEAQKGPVFEWKEGVRAADAIVASPPKTPG